MSYFSLTENSIPVHKLKRGDKFVKSLKGLPTSKIYRHESFHGGMVKCTLLPDNSPRLIKKHQLVFKLNS